MNKAAVRALVRAHRDARDEPARDAAGMAIADHAVALVPAGPADVACFMSLPAEPRTDPLIARLHSTGRGVLVPRIRGRDLDWVPLREGSVLARGPLGIREPTGPGRDASTLDSLAVMFVPAIAVDREGRRLGQGGGYYDRVLAGVTRRANGGPLLVAVLYDEEILDVVPAEPHDCRVDAAVTPTGIVRFSAM